MKTPEQIAEEIIDEWQLRCRFTHTELFDLIAQAIQAERDQKIPWPTPTEIETETYDLSFADDKLVVRYLEWQREHVEKKMSEQ